MKFFCEEKGRLRLSYADRGKVEFLKKTYIVAFWFIMVASVELRRKDLSSITTIGVVFIVFGGNLIGLAAEGWVGTAENARERNLHIAKGIGKAMASLIVVAGVFLSYYLQTHDDYKENLESREEGHYDDNN